MRTDRRYGWNPDRPDHRDRYRSAAPSLLANLPHLVDLSTDPAMPGVYDQQQIGSCTANAIAGAFEFDLRKQKITDFMPSRLFVYYNERAMEHNVGFDSGAQIRDGVRSVAKQGVCPESMWAYDGRPANDDGSWPAGHRAGMRPTDQCYAAAKMTEAIRYERVIADELHLKSVLAGGVPFVFGFTVYSSFESEAVAESGDAPMPQPGDSVLGGHAVLAVGYDDSRRRFLVRNSWGASWGKAGYFTMPYVYLTDSRLASDFWVVRKVS